jgi:hypothetical protein
MASAAQDKHPLNDASARTSMLLCNVAQESKAVFALQRDGFPLVVCLYFQNPTRDANEYHLSQWTLVLIANAIGSLNNNDFGFLIACYESQLINECHKSINENRMIPIFREIKSHVFLVNVFAAVASGHRDDKWKQQFRETIDIFKLLSSMNAAKAIVVLLRSLSDPTAARRLRDRVEWITTGLHTAHLTCMDKIHDDVRIAECAHVPSPAVLDALDMAIGYCL